MIFQGAEGCITPNWYPSKAAGWCRPGISRRSTPMAVPKCSTTPTGCAAMSARSLSPCGCSSETREPGVREPARPETRETIRDPRPARPARTRGLRPPREPENRGCRWYVTDPNGTAGNGRRCAGLMVSRVWKRAEKGFERETPETRDPENPS
jgi:hypothetical protein